MNTTQGKESTVKELRAALLAIGINAPSKATKAALLALLPDNAPESPESPESAESLESGTARAEDTSAAESALVAGLTRKGKAALVSAESKRHTLYIASAGDKSVDVFAAFKFLTAGESFAALNTDSAEFIHIDSLRLGIHALYVQVSIEAYAKQVNTLRGNAESIVKVSGGSLLVPVRIVYDAKRDSFTLESVLESSLMRYSKSKGFSGLDDSAIARAIPGMDSASIKRAIVRKLRAYVGNNAAMVNDRTESRNGAPTLFGLYRAALESAKK